MPNSKKTATPLAAGTAKPKTKGASVKAKPKASVPLAAVPHELHAVLSLSIADLDLVDYAEASAEKLKSDFPSVIFTSGRRNSQRQADAMAGNIAQNRKWIEQTYLVSPEREELQAWVDS